MHTKSLHELINALQTKDISSVELTQYYLNRIQNASTLNAFITIDEEHALVSAKKADKQRQLGQARPLTGIPFAHKDIFCTKKMPTTCGSKMLEHFYSPYSATIVERFEAESAVLLGKTNMDEFAMGSTNENSYFGAVKNPWNLTCTSGGSSGGSASAVAADLIPFATGSDTGGSIRQPAAFCGISGLKPTYGLVSRFGLIAYASSLDQAGPMARRAEDLAIILNSMAGFDEKDSTSADTSYPDYVTESNKSLKGLRIGVQTRFLNNAIDDDIQSAIHEALKFFEQTGAEIVKIDLPLQPLWVPCYYVIACGEASSNLSRYDGIRFGFRADDAPTLRDLIVRTRSEGFGVEVKRRILTGTYLLSSNHYDDYYVQAQKIRRMIQTELQNVLSTVDVIIGPTTPTCAYKLGEKDPDPTQRYLGDVFTVAANLAGFPALSIPVGFKNELPIGMQIMGNQFSETQLLSIAKIFQQNTNWHLNRPNLLNGEEA